MKFVARFLFNIFFINPIKHFPKLSVIWYGIDSKKIVIGFICDRSDDPKQIDPVLEQFLSWFRFLTNKKLHLTLNIKQWKKI